MITVYVGMDDFGMDALMETSKNGHTNNISAEIEEMIRSRSASGAESDAEEEESGGCDEVSVVSSQQQQQYMPRPRPQPQPRYDTEDSLTEKRELLYQFDRLQKKGHKLPRQFNMASDLAEMRAEYERIKRNRSVDTSVAFQRKMVIAAVSGMEYLNGKFDPFNVKLDGWSEGVQDKITDMDDLFEELYDKYKTKGKMPPEVRLLMSLAGGAVMAHLTNTLFKNSLPGMDQVLKQNPGLMKQFASAAMGTMAGNAKQDNGGVGNIASGLAGFMSNMMGGGGGQPPPKPAGKMKGPGNFDAIMRETQNFTKPAAYTQRRVEVFSNNASDEELSELHDDVSLSGLSLSSKRNKKILSL